jgi:anthranilate synthase component 2
MTELIKQYISTKPILGICLGCQALGEYFGAELYNMKAVKHGLQTPIKIIDHKNLYEGLPNTIAVGRYHSWALKLKDDSNLIPTAYDEQNTLMSFRHRDLAVYGIQYHPESIMSPDGMKLIENWMNSIKG